VSGVGGISYHKSIKIIDTVKMKYAKEPKTITEQLDQLRSRGLEFTFEENAIHKLKHIGYYRLSAYMKFYQVEGDQYKPKTDFEDVLELYTFDRELKLLLFDAVERIEIALRSNLVHLASVRHGAFWYMNEELFLDRFDSEKHKAFVRKRISKSRGNSVFLKHFYKKYEDEHPPSWIFIELLSFGEVLNIFEGLLREERKIVAIEFGIDEKLLISWMKGLVDIRNTCAHHGRLWNHHIKPPHKYDSLKLTSNGRIYDYLLIIKYFLTVISPRSEWSAKLDVLLNDHPHIPKRSMGFPS
jgi:abortive infection bacteriophage resistance protein